MRQTINQINLNVMLLIKIIGFIIIFLNIAGFGFLLYVSGIKIKDKFSPGKKAPAVKRSLSKRPLSKKKEPKIINDDIIPEEDDLLKDMDLSDLDNLKFDDFD